MNNDLPLIQSTLDGPMADGSSPELLAHLLATYEQELTARGVPVESWLAPGLEPEEVRRALVEVGLSANKEILVWFGWHNGCSPRTGTDRPEMALPRMIPASLSLAIERYRATLDFEVPAGAERSWFENGAGEGWLMLGDHSFGCALDCTKSESPPPAPQVRYANDAFGEPGMENAFRALSLCTVVTWWITGLRNGAYTWNPRIQDWDEHFELLPATQVAAFFI